VFAGVDTLTLGPLHLLAFAAMAGEREICLVIKREEIVTLMDATICAAVPHTITRIGPECDIPVLLC
jgi:hypothetical protein